MGMDRSAERSAIGKIVKSNNHVDYVCQVFGPGEIDQTPPPADYAFGTFVSVQLQEGALGAGRLVGVIYNTLLLNPEFGSLGPRLSPRADIEIFSPDYLSETATLVGVFTVGWFDAVSQPAQGVPAAAATVNALVQRLTRDEVAQFHTDRGGRLALHYAPLLLNQNNPLTPPLLLAIIDQLSELFSGSRSQLAVMRNNLAWKTIVQPIG